MSIIDTERDVWTIFRSDCSVIEWVEIYLKCLIWVSIVWNTYKWYIYVNGPLLNGPLLR